MARVPVLTLALLLLAAGVVAHGPHENDLARIRLDALSFRFR